MNANLFDLEAGPSRVEVIRADGKVLIRVRGISVALFDDGDVGAMHCAVVGLAETNEVTGREVAQALGIHEGHVSRLRRYYRAQGSAGLVPRPPGPRGKSKLTGPILEQIGKLKQKRLTVREIGAQLGISAASVSRATAELFLPQSQESDDQAESVTGSIDAAVSPAEARMETAGAPASGSSEADLECQEDIDRPVADAPTEALAVGPLPEPPLDGPIAVQHAGAMMLHVPLSRLGLVDAFKTAGANLSASRVHDLAGVLGTLSLGFGLGLANVEQFKLAVRGNLGPMAGLPAAPEVRTLRRKLYELSDQVDMTVLVREVARGVLGMQPAWEGLYFVDGHFGAYTGELAAPKTRHPKKQCAARGRTDTWVHDVQARPIFFLTSPIHEQLVSTIPRVVTEIQAVAGEDSRIFLIFDRGGYSAELFALLMDQDVDFATYLKGTPSGYVPPPDSDFRRRYWTFEGKRHWYEIAETELTLGEYTYRVVVKRDGGKHIPIITNLWNDNPAKIAHLVKLRWRQENGLKDLVHNSFIDGIVEYGGDEQPDTTKIPHPEREKLKVELAGVRHQRLALQAEVGESVRENPATPRSTVRGFKVAHNEQCMQIEQLLAKEGELENAISLLPARIRRCDLDPSKIRVILRTERRVMVNTIKLAVDNAERWLSRKFLAHFPDLDEYRARLRSLLRQPGQLDWDASSNTLVATLHPPDSPKVREALAGLLADLNAESPRTLDGRWALRFALSD